MKKAILLIIGVILLAIGGFQNTRYEDQSITVTAVITRVDTDDRTDDGPISYKHTYYGEYTVDGKTYTDVELAAKYTSDSTPDPSVGGTMDIQVSPEDPGETLSDGGIFIVAGMVLVVWGIVSIVKARKKAKTETPAE